MNAGNAGTNAAAGRPPGPMSECDAWIGRTEVTSDTVSAVQVRQMAALLNHRDRMLDPGRGPLPAGWHWCYFNPLETTAGLGGDGHPRRGGFLPPVPLPRRMWAGSRLQWSRAFAVGSRVSKESRIAGITQKSGRKGGMVFVTVEHRYWDEQGPILHEEQDIVYRDEPGGEERAALRRLPEEAAAWRAARGAFEREGTSVKPVRMGAVELFRYSAATFNGHRIHYDLDYSRGEEGYPALVVHGPLIATLLLDLVETELAPGRRIASFRFQARQPTFVLDGGFHLHATPGARDEDAWQVWSTNNLGRVGLDGSITFAREE